MTWSISERARAGLVALGAAVATPLLVLGPGFILDDWIFVRNRHYGGFLETATTPDWLATARPGAWLVYVVGFGTLYQHPALLYLVQAAAAIAVALAFRRLLRRFFSEAEATLSAGVWLLLPIHSATDRWAAALNISVAVLLSLVGLDVLVRAVRGEPRWALSTGLLVAAILTYESVAPLVVVAAGLTWWRGREPKALYVLVSVTVTTLWSVAFTPKATSQVLFDFTTLPGGHFGRAAFGNALVVALPLLILGAVAALREQPRLLGLGLAVIAVGATAYVKFPLELRGIGDRANAATSLGTAMVCTAVLLSLTRRRALLAVGLAALAFVPVRLERDREYADAGADVFRLIAAAPAGDYAVLGPCPKWDDNVTALQGGWDASPAVQFLRRDPDARAEFGRDGPYMLTSRGCELPERWRATRGASWRR